MDSLEEQIVQKMRAGAVAEPAIQAFLGAVRKARAGDKGMTPERDIDPIPDLPRLADMPAARPADAALLKQLAFVKLNGGLGTGMGLDRAKSLIVVKEGQTFLDFIARQVVDLRRRYNAPELVFLLMNSFSTREETLAFLNKYPDLAAGGELDFVQSKAPKLDAKTLGPVTWSPDPELEWCPPGHGDFYPSLLGSGALDRLLKRGIKYLFISNSDNLGATVDLALLRHFAESGLSFLMEVAERTPSDKKGGHLARRKSTGRFLLRESAQCPEGDTDAFQDISKHRFFNTNNLWIRLDHLAEALRANNGAIPLPLIANSKTVDPKRGDSTPVLQLESAMGAAIESFEKSGGIVVPRSRFAPVKTTSDLLALRSDAYTITDDYRIVLAPERNGQPPTIDLDSKRYKIMSAFEEAFPHPLSLVDCDRMKVQGAFRFEQGVRCRGDVEFANNSNQPERVPAGEYTGKVELRQNQIESLAQA